MIRGSTETLNVCRNWNKERKRFRIPFWNNIYVLLAFFNPKKKQKEEYKLIKCVNNLFKTAITWNSEQNLWLAIYFTFLRGSEHWNILIESKKVKNISQQNCTFTSIYPIIAVECSNTSIQRCACDADFCERKNGKYSRQPFHIDNIWNNSISYVCIFPFFPNYIIVVVMLLFCLLLGAAKNGLENNNNNICYFVLFVAMR